MKNPASRSCARIRRSSSPALRAPSPPNGGEGKDDPSVVPPCPRGDFRGVPLAPVGRGARGDRPKCSSGSVFSRLGTLQGGAFASLLVLPKRLVWLALIFFGIATKGPTYATDWTEPVEIRQEAKRCVSYRARLDGQFLVVQATHEKDWHTYAMDNTQRAQEKLAGRKSLGIDRPTEIGLSEGLQLNGPWYQSPPKDFSKPDLRWFAWGFEGRALFVAKVRPSGKGPARIAIRGQACSQTTCKYIELEMSVPLPKTNSEGVTSEIDLRNLVQVH